MQVLIDCYFYAFFMDEQLLRTYQIRASQIASDDTAPITPFLRRVYTDIGLSAYVEFWCALVSSERECS